MDSGFQDLKDYLDVIVIPLAIVAIGISWPMIQSTYRCRKFRHLARRELEEVSPYPENAKEGSSWKCHLKKRFVHQKIVGQPTENRDFLLGLNPQFLYWISQLWIAYEQDDSDQWLHYLCELKEHRYTSSLKLRQAYEKWESLIASYNSKTLDA